MIRLLPHQEKITNRMLSYSKGQVISPTGSGKTMCMIHDAMRRFSITTPRNIVVVAPRILLAEQLCNEFLEHINNAHALHVHSGETEHYSTTKSNRIHAFVNMVNATGDHCIIFTSYHSLHFTRAAISA
jgi:superfamily II DNA or RNA helicase